MTTMTTNSTQWGLMRAMPSMLRRAALVSLFAGVAAGAAEAQVRMTVPDQTAPIALRGATIHTVTNGVIENGTIIFENGRITAVGDNVTIPAGAEIVDVTGKHIYPGLIDAYSTVGISEVGSVDVSNDTNELGDFNPNIQANVAINGESRHIGTSRSAGVLITLTTPGGGLVSGMSSAINLEGWTWEEMTLKGAAALNVNWPSSRRGRFGGGGGANAYEGQIQELRDFFANARAYNASVDAGNPVPTDSRYAAMRPALTGEIPVVVSANSIQEINDALNWAEDEGVRIVIRGGQDAEYVADRLVEQNVPVILTSTMEGPDRSSQGYDGAYARATRLWEKGVKFAISGGGGAAYTNRLPWEAGVAVAFGLPEEEAIKALTINAAEMMGIADEVGSLEPGKAATLLITTGSPLDYTGTIDQAYIQGRKIDMMDIHKWFFEKYMEKLRQRQPWLIM